MTDIQTDNYRNPATPPQGNDNNAQQNVPNVSPTAETLPPQLPPMQPKTAAGPSRLSRLFNALAWPSRKAIKLAVARGAFVGGVRTAGFAGMTALGFTAAAGSATAIAFGTALATGASTVWTLHRDYKESKKDAISAGFTKDRAEEIANQGHFNLNTYNAIIAFENNEGTKIFNEEKAVKIIHAGRYDAESFTLALGAGYNEEYALKIMRTHKMNTNDFADAMKESQDAFQAIGYALGDDIPDDIQDIVMCNKFDTEIYTNFKKEGLGKSLSPSDALKAMYAEMKGNKKLKPRRFKKDRTMRRQMARRTLLGGAIFGVAGGFIGHWASDYFFGIDHAATAPVTENADANAANAETAKTTPVAPTADTTNAPSKDDPYFNRPNPLAGDPDASLTEAEVNANQSLLKEPSETIAEAPEVTDPAVEADLASDSAAVVDLPQYTQALVDEINNLTTNPSKHLSSALKSIERSLANGNEPATWAVKGAAHYVLRDDSIPWEKAKSLASEMINLADGRGNAQVERFQDAMEKITGTTTRPHFRAPRVIDVAPATSAPVTIPATVAPTAPVAPTAAPIVPAQDIPTSIAPATVPGLDVTGALDVITPQNLPFEPVRNIFGNVASPYGPNGAYTRATAMAKAAIEKAHEMTEGGKIPVVTEDVIDDQGNRHITNAVVAQASAPSTTPTAPAVTMDRLGRNVDGAAVSFTVDQNPNGSYRMHGVQTHREFTTSGQNLISCFHGDEIKTIPLQEGSRWSQNVLQSPSLLQLCAEQLETLPKPPAVVEGSNLISRAPAPKMANAA